MLVSNKSDLTTFPALAACKLNFYQNIKRTSDIKTDLVSRANDTFYLIKPHFMRS